MQLRARNNPLNLTLAFDITYLSPLSLFVTNAMSGFKYSKVEISLCKIIKITNFVRFIIIKLNVRPVSSCLVSNHGDYYQHEINQY